MMKREQDDEVHLLQRVSSGNFCTQMSAFSSLFRLLKGKD